MSKEQLQTFAAFDADLVTLSTTAANFQLAILNQQRAAATISPDGQVAIDWGAAEELASAPDRGIAAAIARIMLAIRDNTYDAH